MEQEAHLSLSAAVRQSYSTPAAVEKYRERTREGLRVWEERIAVDHLPDAGGVLVLGCGAGREAFGLEERGYQVTGADLSPALLAQARSLAGDRGSKVRFVQADGRTLPFVESAFAAVTLWSQVLGNVPGAANRLALLEQAHRALCPGGVLTLSVHDGERTRPLVPPDTLVSVDHPEPGDLYLREPDEDTTRYWHYFRREELIGLCRSAGFDGPTVVHTSDLGQTWDNVLVAVCTR